MSYVTFNNILGAAGVAGGAGGIHTGGGGAGASSYVLVQQKLEEWEWYSRFIEMNPDLKERWEQHKTYEILNNEQFQQR